MLQRPCRFCQCAFYPSRCHPGQTVCKAAECQQRRRREYHSRKVATDPVYRQVCNDSSQKWRAQNPDYWKQYREAHPDKTDRNRTRQQLRDQKRRVRNLANNNLALDLRSCAAGVWLFGPAAKHLANNTLATTQVYIVEGLNRPPRDLANLNRRSVAKYLIQPAPPRPRPQRTSKLEPFHTAIGELLEQDPSASAVVILQRLRGRGFDGGVTILKDYLHKTRTESAARRAYVRVESPPGDRFEIDWGHFDSLDYAGDKRKLYAFSLVECHSRMMYIEFTHSQCFETFVRCHVHAFQALGGIARHLVYDNLATAVAEHEGNAGDPMSALRWTNQSTQSIAEELTRRGHVVIATCYLV